MSSLESRLSANNEPFNGQRDLLAACLKDKQQSRIVVRTRANQNSAGGAPVGGGKQAAPRAAFSWYRRVVEGGEQAQKGGGGGGGGAGVQQQAQQQQNGAKQGKKRNSIIAHAGSNFVDKLTYMIKRSNNTLTRSESDFGGGGDGDGDESARNRQERRQASNIEPEEKRVSSDSATSSGSNRYLLSELSLRLVRRCKRTRAVQFAIRGSTSANSSSSVGAANSKRIQDQSSTLDSKKTSKQKHLAKTDGLGSMAPQASNIQEQQQSSASVGNLTTNKINSTSTSALSTTTFATPSSSGCYYCDHEHSASSGFISSSCQLAGIGVNCLISDSGGATTTCSDSITTHSCASSTYNHEHELASFYLHQDQPTAITTRASSPLTEAKSSALELSVEGDSEEMKEQQESPTILSNNNNNNATKKKAKSGGSILSRARNSAINLASLATVTQRFHYSNSVNNLWSSPNQQQRRELNELSGETQNVKPIEYNASAQFDHYDASTSDDSNNNNLTVEPKQGAANCSTTNTSNKSLFSISPSSNNTSCSTMRKTSTSKEKKNRQKELERVEKLRMLVSYLKSGSSQQFINPTASEVVYGETSVRDTPTRSWSSELILSSTPNVINNQTITATPKTNDTLAKCPSSLQASDCNPQFISPTTTIISLNSSISNSNSNDNTNLEPVVSKQTSAWTNPQNLATWIDNEVNSLVNDLEATSQFVIKEKQVKSSKLKWLSSSNNRRDSSGTHST